MYACFIVYNKAFDKVRYDQLMNILKRKQLDYRDLRIISNLYYNQKAIVCIDKRASEEIEVRREVDKDACCHQCSLTHIQNKFYKRH